MGTKHTILISPRDSRTAVFEQLGSENSHAQAGVSLDGRTLTLGDYLARFPATEFAVADSLGDGATALTAAKDRSYTLDFLLMLFDHDLSTSLKSRAADELDELLECEANRNYVLDIVLSQPLPKDTDFNAAKLLGRKNGATQQLVGVLEATRQRAEFAFDAWLAIRKHPMVTQFGPQLVRAKLIQSGTIRKVVTELTTRQRAHELRGSVAMTAQSHLDGRIVLAFLNEYQGLLPEGVHVAAKLSVSWPENRKVRTPGAAKHRRDWHIAFCGETSDKLSDNVEPHPRTSGDQYTRGDRKEILVDNVEPYPRWLVLALAFATTVFAISYALSLLRT